ncbi:hypothetical protein EON62_01130 [archaeon]|nr:MAG: hypothetical protein EON62_01130 [archaeon]
MQFHIVQTGVVATPFTVYARVGDTPDWSSVTTRLSLTSGMLDSFSLGELWFGVGAKAYGGTEGTTATAHFDNYRMLQPLPTSMPLDLYGRTDVCTTVTSIGAVSQVVPGSQKWAAFYGLSANFPYTVRVVMTNGAGEVSQPSTPVPGTYFWARNMPPRAGKLALWLNARGLNSGVRACALCERRRERACQ